MTDHARLMSYAAIHHSYSKPGKPAKKENSRFELIMYDGVVYTEYSNNYDGAIASCMNRYKRLLARYGEEEEGECYIRVSDREDNVSRVDI